VYWGPQGVHAYGYPEEIAAFVLKHSGGGPAVLWPEFEPPPEDLGPDGEFGPRLLRQLGALVGRPVLQLPSGAPALMATRLDVEHGDLLLIQVAGSSGVQVAPGGPDGSPITLRLRKGEVLHLPDGSSAELLHEPGSRHALLRIGPRGQPVRERPDPS
jgi:hypothetical protein